MSQPGPPTNAIRLVLPGGPATPQQQTGTALWPLALLLPLCLAAAVLLHRARAGREPPADAAFRKLARRLGLSRADRRALREIAGPAHPVALLLSPSALRRALETSGPDEPAARAVRRLTRP